MLRELSDARIFQAMVVSTKSANMVATMTFPTMLADMGAEARRQLAQPGPPAWSRP